MSRRPRRSTTKLSGDGGLTPYAEIKPGSVGGSIRRGKRSTRLEPRCSVRAGAKAARTDCRQLPGHRPIRVPCVVQRRRDRNHVRGWHCIGPHCRATWST
jgi:hypothetical protein